MIDNFGNTKHTKESGSLMISALLVGVLMMGLGIMVSNVATTQLVRTHRNISEINALQVAEAGIEKTISQLNADEDFTGYIEEEFFNNDSQGRGLYTTEVSEGLDNEKYIVSTGSVYRYISAGDDPVAVRRIRVTVVGTGSEGFSVHAGPGGLRLGGSANITNSDVYVNGSLQLSGASRIGTATSPAEVNVANIRCPVGNNPGPTYPQLCNPGNQPISLAWSTRIFGTVCATYQTSTGPNNNIQPGDSGAGLLVTCDAPNVTPPSYNRVAHINNVSVTAASNNNLYVCQSWPFQRVWPENLRLNGNVSIGGSCDITIEGDAYITGDLTIGGASTIRVSDTLGNDRPTIIVDGRINVAGSGQIIPNSQGTGIHFISFRSQASCGANCTELSGNELYQSQQQRTVDIGGAVNLPGMIFQSYWGTVRIGGSGSVGAVAGQAIDMSGAGTVVFGTALASGERTWRATSYQELPVIK